VGKLLDPVVAVVRNKHMAIPVQGDTFGLRQLTEDEPRFPKRPNTSPVEESSTI
jgi:hypothetical protein